MASGWRKNPKFDRPKFGQRLRAARTLLGLSFGDLSRLTRRGGQRGINRSTFKHVEDGERDLPETELKPYCTRLISALEVEAKRQRKHLDSDGLWEATGFTLSSPLSRRTFITHSSAAGTAVILPPSTGGSLEASAEQQYDSLMAEGNHLSSILEYVRAEHRYAQAASVARNAGLLEAEALALARQAYALRRRSRLQAAWKLSTIALERLGAANPALERLSAVDLAPELLVSSTQIHARATGDLWIQAYAMVARVRGHIADDLEDFATARAAFMTLANIGDEKRDDVLRAHAEIFLGRLLVSEGTDIGDDERWRKIVDRSKVEEGIRRIRGAQGLFRGSDQLWRAHALYQEAKAMRLLKGKSKAALRVEQHALVAFADSRAVGNVYLTQGWLGLADGSANGTIEGQLGRAHDLGWEIGSGLMASEALAALAEFHACLPRRRPETIAHSLAGIGLWPSSKQARDFRRMTRLFTDLEVSVSEVRLALNNRAGPLERAARRPEFNDRLRNRLSRLAPELSAAVPETF